MKKLALVITTLSVSLFYAQEKMNSYTAHNGITYKIGDKLFLGEGSDNGEFKHLTIAGLFKTVNNITKNDNPDDGVNPSFAGKQVTLKKIKTIKKDGDEKVIFIVNKGMVANYELNIEGAINTCEIKDCEVKDNYESISNDDTTTEQPAHNIASESKSQKNIPHEKNGYMSDEKMEALIKLKKLKDNDILSEEEFQKEKSKILN